MNQIRALLLVLLLVAGCSGQSQSPVIATLTPIPTFVFTAPTEAPSVLSAATTVNTNQNLDAEAIERGRGRYEVLGCAACHGENGEGGEAPSLTASSLSEEDFISFMRSGGELGAAHQYATNRLSDTGGRNLYQYLFSIRS